MQMQMQSPKAELIYIYADLGEFCICESSANWVWRLCWSGRGRSLSNNLVASIVFQAQCITKYIFEYLAQFLSIPLACCNFSFRILMIRENTLGKWKMPHNGVTA